MSARDQTGRMGFGQVIKQFVLSSGESGTSVDPVDMGRPCFYWVMRCADCSAIPASTTVTAQAGETDNDDLCYVDDISDPNTLWQGVINTTGSVRTVLKEAAGAQRLRLVLDAVVTSGGATFELIGLVGGRDKD